MTSTFPETTDPYAESMFRAGMLAAASGIDYLLVHKAGRLIVEIFENSAHNNEVILAGATGPYEDHEARVYLQRDIYYTDRDALSYATLSFGHGSAFHVTVTSHSFEDLRDPNYVPRPQLDFETDDLDKALEGFLISFSVLRPTR